MKQEIPHRGCKLASGSGKQLEEAFLNFSEILEESGVFETEKDRKLIVPLITILLDRTAPIQEKLECLRSLQILLMVPSVTALRGADEIDPIKLKKARAAQDVILLLQNLEKSLYQQYDFTTREEIDFTHPKVQKGFEFMIVEVLEIMKDMGLEQSTIMEFTERFSTSMVGFEQELNTRLKGVGNAALDLVRNPLLENVRDARAKKAREFETTNEAEVIGNLLT